jgi:hypothetical protein
MAAKQWQMHYISCAQGDVATRQGVDQQLAVDAHTEESRALKDLCDLQRLGMQVRLPITPRSAPCSEQEAIRGGVSGMEQATQHEPQENLDAAADKRKTEGSAEENDDALKELREMQLSGLKVSFPRC